MGRDYSARHSKKPKRISTHTPAWGATLSVDIRYYRIHISTHTPAWGATKSGLSRLWSKIISTHTPAWGATAKIRAAIEESENFNSHARVGRD